MLWIETPRVYPGVGLGILLLCPFRWSTPPMPRSIATAACLEAYLGVEGLGMMLQGGLGFRLGKPS